MSQSEPLRATRRDLRQGRVGYCNVVITDNNGRDVSDRWWVVLTNFRRCEGACLLISTRSGDGGRVVMRGTSAFNLTPDSSSVLVAWREQMRAIEATDFIDVDICIGLAFERVGLHLAIGCVELHFAAFVSPCIKNHPLRSRAAAIWELSCERSKLTQDSHRSQRDSDWSSIIAGIIVRSGC